MDNKLTSQTCFIDLSKAFDNNNHERLIYKIDLCGFRGKFLNLIKTYLANRFQFVEFHSCCSKTKMIKYGVPQRSVLEPLLFLIYINDLPANIGDADSVLYADDTTIFGSKKDEVLDSLKQSEEWFRENALSINPEKCIWFVLITINSTITYASQKNWLSWKQNIWVLFLIKNLTFENHIEKVANKLQKFNGILYKTRDYFSKKQFLMFYDAYAKSIIGYRIFFMAVLWKVT